MDVYRTEEEQVEALKKWWQEHSTAIVSTVAAVAIVVGGWQLWSDQQTNTKSAASSQYQTMLEAMNSAPIEGKEGVRAATMTHIADGLKNEHSGSVYAQYAGLLLARQAVDDADLTTAEAELRGVIAAKPEAEILAVANYRLAKVLFATERESEALALLEAAKSQKDVSGLAPAYAELQGDILLNQGKTGLARSAYQEAATARAVLGLDIGRFLQMKIDGLAVALPGVVIDEAGASDKAANSAAEGEPTVSTEGDS